MICLLLSLILADIVFVDDFSGNAKWYNDIAILNCSSGEIAKYNLKCPNISQSYLYFTSYPYSSSLSTYSNVIVPTYSGNASIQILYYGQNYKGQNITVSGFMGETMFPAFLIDYMEGWSYSTIYAELPDNLQTNISVGLNFTYSTGNSPGYLQIAQIIVTVISYYPQPISPVLSRGQIIMLACGVTIILIALAVIIVALIRNRCRIFSVCSCRKRQYEFIQ